MFFIPGDETLNFVSTQVNDRTCPLGTGYVAGTSLDLLLFTVCNFSSGLWISVSGGPLFSSLGNTSRQQVTGRRGLRKSHRTLTTTVGDSVIQQLRSAPLAHVYTQEAQR